MLISPFGLDFGTLDFGTSDSGLTILDTRSWNLRWIWGGDLECEAGGEFEPARGQVEAPGADLEAGDRPQLGLEPGHGGLTGLRGEGHHDVTILKGGHQSKICRYYLLSVRVSLLLGLLERFQKLSVLIWCASESIRWWANVFASPNQSDTHIARNCLKPELLCCHEMPGLRNTSSQHLRGCN